MIWITIEQIDETCQSLNRKLNKVPEIGIILGSGLGGLADMVAEPTIIPYTEIPNWPKPGVQGHVGRLVSGELEGKQVLLMQGRSHFYERGDIRQPAFPVRVMNRLGVKTLIVTNAAGAIDADYVPGDVMLITDHINMVGMAGANPLVGPNLDEFGPRFPDMSQPYDRELQRLCVETAAEAGIDLKQGVYVWLSGPSFESPADLRFLRVAGADAVGMSTVPEVIVARHGGMRVLGLSGISNKANLDGSTLTTHEEVLEAGKLLVPKLTSLIRGVLRKM
ncbi:MAG TPA: purine-nucleoside phosphorylase [Bellilinea sp.]|nr:purine-nucleoside phosphorylase [Bellilinea sp.]